MPDAADTMDINYASDLQLIRSMHEDDSFWDCIFDAKLDFLNNNADPHLASCVRPEVADSWINSRNSGLAPDRVDLGKYIDEETYAEALATNTQLIETARSLINKIESLNLQNDYTFELLDVDGTSLLQIGDLKLHQFMGANYQCDERNLGTNAHTLCMRHKKPFVIIGPEHYCFALHSLIACAAPIITQLGTSIGALMLTQPIPDGPFTAADKKVLIHAMSLISSLATALSDQLRIDDYDIQLAETQSKYSKATLEAQRFESISRNIMNTVKGGIVICDAEGIITLATPEASHLFKVPPEDLLETNALTLLGDGRPFDEVVKQGGATTVIIDEELHEAKISQISGSANDLEGYIIAIGEAKRSALGASRGKVGDTAKITFKDILGKSYQITKAKDLASRFAHSRENILLIGESGTGKELFAQSVHNQTRPDGPFMSINCAAIPPRLIESELFGYESGSFTGAERGGKPGKIELADGGTLFLDEIGDMPLELQATLLRVLENKRVIRVGGKSYKQIDFRLVAATNQNLPKLVSQHQFREDLFYRISVLTVDLPPLRDRLGDALYFARFFLNECQIRTDGGKVELSSEAARFVSSYAWPGNVRQLKHAIYAAYYTCENHSISVDDFPSYIVNAPDSQHRKDDEGTTAENNSESLNESSSSIKVPDTATATSAAKNDDPVSTSDGSLPTLSLKELEALAINEAILQADGNIATAAAILDISKATLYRKLKENQ
ncbi:MAG: sigma 54-interacting transcriptional regulator [Gordonibacter sp.]|uniref:sigma-54 interaction domain-containing protein n=1 Tax=Gordonibacter sp. TaxID=1968902 RepID=UPI002FCAE30A